ncbi:MAG: hypothetical protein EBY51_08265 [Actinobacteria bacterium]|nr:hypothetical protein [Actinomycetota bacterium]
MNRVTAQPIPWVFTDMPGILMWTWVSDHFVARIAGAEINADAANAASEGEVAPVAATAGAFTTRRWATAPTAVRWRTRSLSPTAAR